MDESGERVCNIISDGFVINSVCSNAFSKLYLGLSGFVENETTANIDSVYFDDDGDGVYDRFTNNVSGFITLTNDHNTLIINNLIIDSNYYGIFFEGDCLVQKTGN